MKTLNRIEAELYIQMHTSKKIHKYCRSEEMKLVLVNPEFRNRNGWKGEFEWGQHMVVRCRENGNPRKQRKMSEKTYTTVNLGEDEIGEDRGGQNGKHKEKHKQIEPHRSLQLIHCLCLCLQPMTIPNWRCSVNQNTPADQSPHLTHCYSTKLTVKILLCLLPLSSPTIIINNINYIKIRFYMYPK